MAWDIEATDEFKQWFAGLAEPSRFPLAVRSICSRCLDRYWEGPMWIRSKGSRFPNMKELRVQHGGKPYRVLFAFDPRQTGILLIGGRKGAKGWYEKAIALADGIYSRYLARKRG